MLRSAVMTFENILPWGGKVIESFCEIIYRRVMARLELCETGKENLQRVIAGTKSIRDTTGSGTQIYLYIYFFFFTIFDRLSVQKNCSLPLSSVLYILLAVNVFNNFQKSLSKLTRAKRDSFFFDWSTFVLQGEK